VNEVLVVTGGHRFDVPAFTAMLDAVCDGWASWTHATQPEAQQLLTPANAGRWAAVVLYDIAGLALARGAEPAATSPSEQVQADLRALFDAGQGLVVLHHSIASWPAWDGWAHAVGGRYLYAPGTLDSRRLDASGYRMDRHTVEVIDRSHPVCDGVTDRFEVDDEIYWCPVFDDEVVPLLATTADLAPKGFRDTYAEVRHGDATATCAAGSWGSRRVGWAKAAGNSPLVYLQPGHGPSTMQHPDYRRLLSNAVRWVASEAAHTWARANAQPF
jgi:type 1 glutamine amidotransferase